MDEIHGKNTKLKNQNENLKFYIVIFHYRFNKTARQTDFLIFNFILSDDFFFREAAEINERFVVNAILEEKISFKLQIARRQPLSYERAFQIHVAGDGGAAQIQKTVDLRVLAQHVAVDFQFSLKVILHLRA
ncbi:MAG: hypothetical protein PHV68_08145, partial [Candidatus Gastranaerophilales bacterium]|nr:hypothetical protein [Candidatus Gastranaerophilales bacterium]